MSIVVVTIPGPAKQKFVSDLQTATNGAVSLVIVQKRRQPSFMKRLQDWNQLPAGEKITRLYYAARLRWQPALQAQLAVFQATTATEYDATKWAAPTYYTYDVNSESVYERIQALQPTIMTVWGSGLLAQRLVTFPKHALNLHFGISAAYRGAYANQRAVEKGDWEVVGTTIHYLNGRADSGAVVAHTYPAWSSTPYETFSTLHERARDTYVECVARLHKNHSVPTTTPDLSASENLQLKDWTPARRVQVAKRLLQWHKDKQPPISN